MTTQSNAGTKSLSKIYSAEITKLREQVEEKKKIQKSTENL